MVDSLGETKCSNLNPVPQLGHVDVGICSPEVSSVGPWRVDPLGMGQENMTSVPRVSYLTIEARKPGGLRLITSESV